MLSLVTLPRDTSEAVNDKAVLRSAAVNALTVLFALICINLIAFGLFNVNKLEPTVVAPRLVLPVEATKLVEPPSHWALSLYAVVQLLCTLVDGIE